MGPRRIGIVLLACALLGTAVVAQAATFTVINNDGPGEGFNDPTPVAPVGGNVGTTLGAQRLIAFQHAANIWGSLLTSNVPILVNATFDVLACNDSSAVLGSAGPTSFFRDFSGAPIASTWYPLALANALHGSDLAPGTADIDAQFNSSIGTTCSFPRSWYYGLDGAAGANIDFVSVLLHELGHGLGFLTLVDLSTGAKAMGLNDVFMLYLENHGASPADFPSMSNAQRVAASKATGNLHWVGSNVRAASSNLTAGKVGDHVRMFAPSAQQPGSSVSHWDTALTPNQLMEPSYTVPLDPELELPLFQDIGWPLAQAQLSVSLGASPPSGASPLSTTLTATVGGSATGPINYTFWWNCADAGTSVAVVTAICGDPNNPGIGAKFNAVAAASQAVGHTYGSVGTFTAKVIVERGAAPSAEARTAVTSSGPVRTLTVASANPSSGVGIVVSPADTGGQGSGTTQFSRTYNQNTVVSLTAPATAGANVFQKWQRDGVDLTSSTIVQVAMDADHTLTAVYGTLTFTLTVNLGGSALGTVTSNPPGINCNALNGAGCSATFTTGTIVTLTEVPAAGATFKTWRNDCSGTSSTAGVTMTANRLCKAIFSLIFTDATLTPGSTKAKAVHVTELRSAVNQLRAVNNLGAFGFADGSLVPASTIIKGNHVDQLRSALCAAYTAAGLSCPTYGTDPTITPGQTRIKAQHVIDLRNNVRALE
jgi:List-Bact-rpt repeat protein